MNMSHPLTRHRGFRDFTRLLLNRESKALVLVFGLLVAVGLTESIGLLLLIPLLGLVGLDLGGGPLGAISQAVASVFDGLGLEPTLPAILVLYVGIVGARAFLQRWQAIEAEALDQRFVHALRSHLYEVTSAVPWVSFVHRRSSDFVHALTTELDRLSVATSSLLLMMADVVLGGVYLALALAISVPLTLLAAVIGLGLVAVLRGWNARIRAQGERASDLWRDMHAITVEQLRGMKTVRVHGREGQAVDRFSRLSAEVAGTWVETVRSHGTVSALFTVGSAVLLALIVWIAVTWLFLSTATILLLLFLYARLVPRFSAIQSAWHGLVNALPALDTVMELIEWCEARTAPIEENESDPVELHRNIRFEGVSFAYDRPSNRPAVRDLDLDIPAGATVAIVGASGSGKTTVADLLLGLIEPAAGRILVDEAPLAPDRVATWRERVAYVTQETFLLHDTIRDNLLWARPQATTEQIKLALSRAGADTFVNDLPAGLDTVVGDLGVLFSGGERQRIALARALLREPDLLVLDEATSALDYETERGVLDTIAELRGRMTILIITHRLRAVRIADVIHVLDEGRLVESGSWDELVVRPDSVFQRLRAQEELQETYEYAAESDSKTSHPLGLTEPFI